MLWFILLWVGEGGGVYYDQDHYVPCNKVTLAVVVEPQHCVRLTVCPGFVRKIFSELLSLL